MAVIASLAIGATAAKPVKAPAGGKKISNELIGIFFEDISMSADGGLCAELIQNGSFEFSPAERDGWGPGTISTARTSLSLPSGLRRNTEKSYLSPPLSSMPS